MTALSVAARQGHDILLPRFRAGWVRSGTLRLAAIWRAAPWAAVGQPDGSVLRLAAIWMAVPWIPAFLSVGGGSLARRKRSRPVGMIDPAPLCPG